MACIILDEFVADNPIPDLVKLDVEGAESEVLKGADQLFRKHRPALVCEIHDGANAQFVQDWLKERDYSCVWLEVGHNFPRHLRALPAEITA